METTIPFLDLRRAIRSIQADIDQAIRGVIDSGVFLNGDNVFCFEQAWAEYCGQQHCVACASGTDALMLSVSSRSSKMTWCIPGNTTPFTARAIERIADCRILDVNESGWMENTSAVTIPVLLYGRHLPEQGGTRRIFVDACQAHGWRPWAIHTAAWSFYPTKNLGAFGDAGAITTNDSEIAMIARDHAATWHSRMSEIDAAVLLKKLPFLDQWNSDRQQIAAIYWHELSGIDQERMTFACPPGMPSNHHIFAILTDHRDELANHLEKNNIQTKIHYERPLADLPGCNRWCDSTLSLPCYPGLTPFEVQTICDQIKVFLQ